MGRYRLPRPGHFTLHRKKFWVTPIVAVLGALGGVIVVFQGSAIAPFIYSLW
jgi:hypothetical protein